MRLTFPLCADTPDTLSDRLHAVLDISASYEIAEPSGFTPWDSLCRPNSTARRLAESLPVDVPTGNSLKRFVSIEHAQAMDLCEHPDLRPINGFTAWYVRDVLQSACSA